MSSSAPARPSAWWPETRPPQNAKNDNMLVVLFASGVLRRVSGEATGRIRACKRESAARMARAAERVAWLPREPSWAPKGQLDAENRRASLCRCGGDAGAGHFWDISPAVNVLAGANPDGRPGLRHAMPGNVDLGDVAVGARTGARPGRDGC